MVSQEYATLREEMNEYEVMNVRWVRVVYPTFPKMYFFIIPYCCKLCCWVYNKKGVFLNFYSAFQLTKSNSAAHFGSDEVTFDLRCSVV